MSYTVYIHTIPNGKVYIGITGQSVEKRWDNGNGYRNQVFYRAIEKYGWENITHEIVAEGLTKEQAERMEVELIALYKSNDPEYGYNVENGGNAIGKLSEDTKRKISESLTGKPFSDERRQRISEGHKGCHHTDETKRKISESRKGYRHTEETRSKMSQSRTILMTGKKGKDSPASKGVIAFDMDGNVVGQFDCAREACEQLGLPDSMRSHISSCCNGTRKSAGGFYWKRLN